MKKMTVGYNKNCIVLESGSLKIAIATDKGPRVVGCFIGKSKENMFAELPPKPMPQPKNGFCLYGGHRLWHSPEDCPLCYEPDNDPVTIEKAENGGLLISGAVCPSTGVRKSMLIIPIEDDVIAVHHKVENTGLWPLEYASWSLTMMAPGGLVMLPQGYAPDGNPYIPDRNLVLWPYTDLSDKRLKFGERYILVQNDPKQAKAIKLGYRDGDGWIGYANKGNAFIKYIEIDPTGNYPDRGCNIETYTCDVHSEIETLGTLETIQPGEAAYHTEYWQGIEGVGDVKTEKDVIKKIEPNLIDFEFEECGCDDDDCDCHHK